MSQPCFCPGELLLPGEPISVEQWACPSAGALSRESWQELEARGENAPGAMRLLVPDALLQRVDLFIVNETERELMPELADAALVAVTYGAAGAALFRGGEEIARADGVPTRALNTVGAGDAFCAALVLALQSGLPPQSALQTACAVGAAAVAHLSSQPPFDPLARYVPAP